MLHQRLKRAVSSRIPDIIRDKRARAQHRFQRLHLGEDEPVKRDDEHLVKHARAAYLVHDCFSDVRIAALHTVTFARLDLDIDLGVSLRKVQHLAQRRYLLRFRPAARKVRGGIETAQIGKIQVEDIALPVGALVNGIIMNNDGMTIA